jgi:UDP-glucuronate 4-epimerase
MRFLVTGAAGFIGSHVADRLLAAGHRVCAIDCLNDQYDPRFKQDNIHGMRGNPRFAWSAMNLCDAEALAGVWKQFAPEAVIHLAAMAGVRESLQNPRLYFDNNMAGTVNVFELARTLGPKTTVFASSSSVYGNQKKLPFSEDDPTDRSISLYACTKKMGEQLAFTYAHNYGLNIPCLRFFTVYGPRGRPDMAVHKFLRAIERGEPLTMFGDGTSSRDYTYIDDIVDGVLAAAERAAGFSVYNLGRSEAVTLREMIALCAAAVGKPAKIESLPMQPGDVDHTCADVSRARRELGYEPRVSLAEGLARMTAWLRANPHRW